ncbi:MAG: TlpA disulfide reductase family protein [Candidatus Cryosericum sp.]|nr:TlpA family protein disulfide reductase [bacterium]
MKTKPKNKKLASNLTILILAAAAILVAVIIGSALQGTHSSAPSTGTGTSTAPSSLGTGYVIPAFRAMDLQGNIIDNSFFAKQRLTMVNVWGTFCGPCIREMPDLAQLPSVFPSTDFALLGIVADTSFQRTDANKVTEDTARQQMSAAGASYPSIIPDASIMQHLLVSVNFVPTTFFVDRTGTVVGEVLTGSKSKAQWTSIIQGVLASLPAGS